MNPFITRLLDLCSKVRLALRYRGAPIGAGTVMAAQRIQFYEAAWREAAEVLGAEVRDLGDGVQEISRDGLRTRVVANSTPLDDPVTLRIAADKPLTYRLLRRAGLPTPAHQEFTRRSLETAGEFLLRKGRCVIKPAAGTGAGQGVTTGIETVRQLRTAASHAERFGRRLLIEEQLEGDIVRVMLLEGQLIDAVQRCPPTLEGDGRSTIKVLVRRMNERRLAAGTSEAQVLLRPDPDLENTLARQGLQLGSVPPAGARVVLKTVINDNAARENVRATARLSAQDLELARRAAAAVGVRHAGVDLVLPSAGAKDLATVVLEVNTSPGFHYHYFTRGDPERVAIPVLRACLEEARRLSRGAGSSQTAAEPDQPPSIRKS